MRAVVLVALVAFGTSTPAAAGMLCMDAKDYTDAAADLEAFATDKLNPVETTSEVCLRGAFFPREKGEPKLPATLMPRIEKACAKVIDRDGARAALCIELGVRLGKRELGGTNLLDAALTWMLDPFAWDGPDMELWTLGQLTDARAATRIVERWKANLDRAQAWKKRASAMQAWAGWRKDAAAAIGKAGVRADAEFLRAQAAATKDRYVKKACLDAAAAIDKRP